MTKLENKVEPSWPKFKLVDPLEKIVDRLINYGLRNCQSSHAIEEVEIILSYHSILSISNFLIISCCMSECIFC